MILIKNQYKFPENLEIDLVIITTDHSSFDYEMIRNKANIILDTRGIYRDKISKKIYKA